MIIDNLPTIPSTVTTGDELPVERGTTTYKIDYNALAAAILDRLGAGSNGIVDIPHGGTGATAPADACANIGAVKKTGDTMTGNLTIQASQDPAILYCRADGTLRGYTLISNDNRYIVIQKHLNDDNLDLYYFPDADSGSSAGYDVLTSRSPVTIAQGGTGATTPDGARANIGSGCPTGAFTTADGKIVTVINGFITAIT